MPFPRPTLTTLRTSAMQDITGSDLPNADGFLRRSPLRVLAWIVAAMAQEHYGYLDWIAKQSTPFTCTDEFLEAWAALAPTPVIREAPAAASGPVSFQGTVGGNTIPVGVVCSRNDFQAFVTTTLGTPDATGNITVMVQAQTAGSAGNTDPGTPVNLAVSIAGVNPQGAASDFITGGTDLETDDSLRARMLESYANPPHGGDAADFVTWAEQVPGVTRAWVPDPPAMAGTVVVYIMLDNVNASNGGFPHGTNGGATQESRIPHATGDQLTVANYLFPLRPVTMIAYVAAPLPQPQNFTLAGLAAITPTQQSQVLAALSGVLMRLSNPNGDATGQIEQSDIDSAVAAVPGIPGFATTFPSIWPISSAAGSILTLGTVTFA